MRVYVSDEKEEIDGGGGKECGRACACVCVLVSGFGSSSLIMSLRSLVYWFMINRKRKVKNVWVE